MEDKPGHLRSCVPGRAGEYQRAFSTGIAGKSLLCVRFTLKHLWTMKAPEDTAAPDCQRQNKSVPPAVFPSAGCGAGAEQRALQRHKRSLNRAEVKLWVPPFKTAPDL